MFINNIKQQSYPLAGQKTGTRKQNGVYINKTEKIIETSRDNTYYLPSLLENSLPRIQTDASSSENLNRLIRTKKQMHVQYRIVCTNMIIIILSTTTTRANDESSQAACTVPKIHVPTTATTESRRVKYLYTGRQLDRDYHHINTAI